MTLEPLGADHHGQYPEHLPLDVISWLAGPVQKQRYHYYHQGSSSRSTPTTTLTMRTRNDPRGKTFGKRDGAVAELQGAIQKFRCCTLRIPKKPTKCPKTRMLTAFQWPRSKPLKVEVVLVVRTCCVTHVSVERPAHASNSGDRSPGSQITRESDSRRPRHPFSALMAGVNPGPVPVHRALPPL